MHGQLLIDRPRGVHREYPNPNEADLDKRTIPTLDRKPRLSSCLQGFCNCHGGVGSTGYGICTLARSRGDSLQSQYLIQQRSCQVQLARSLCKQGFCRSSALYLLVGPAVGHCVELFIDIRTHGGLLHNKPVPKQNKKMTQRRHSEEVCAIHTNVNVCVQPSLSHRLLIPNS